MKIIKKSALFLLIAAMLLPLTACGNEVNVFEYQDQAISTSMYSYIMSEQKSYILKAYSLTDSEEIWTQQYSDDQTIEEWLMTEIDNYCRTIIVATAMAKQAGVELSEKSQTSLDTLIDSCIETYGGKGKWNAYLSTLGVDIKTFTKYMEMTYLLGDYYDYLVEQGEFVCTEQDEYQYLADYYEGYSLVRHILFNYQFKTTDEDGNSVDLTEDEKAARKAELEELAAKMASGEAKFEDYEEQNEDSGIYYFVTDDNSYVEAFQTAALEMEIGEYRLVETSYGYHLMSKVDYTIEAYREGFKESLGENIQTYVMQDKYYEIFEERADEVSANNDELKKYSLITAPVMS